MEKNQSLNLKSQLLLNAILHKEIIVYCDIRRKTKTECVVKCKDIKYCSR